MNRRPLSFRPRFVDIDRAEAAAQAELNAHDARYAIVAYDRDPAPRAPLPPSLWERFDRSCARITWLHVSVAGALLGCAFSAALLWAALWGSR
jgi:hypothetical protein